MYEAYDSSYLARLQKSRRGVRSGCKKLVRTLKKNGYWDAVMRRGHELDRVKSYLLKFSEKRLVPDDLDVSQPFPQLFPLFDGLSNKPVHSPSDYEWVSVIEQHAQAIADEVNALATTQTVDWEFDGIEDSDMKAVPFNVVGVRLPQLANACSTTFDIIDRLEGRCVGYPFGDEVLSILRPGGKLPPHTSSDNLRLRCMLGISIPGSSSETCGIRVGPHRAGWQDGRVFLFEDSFEHQVWNNESEDRVVLIFDFWHPSLTPEEIEALRYLFCNADVKRLIFGADKRIASREIRGFVKTVLDEPATVRLP